MRNKNIVKALIQECVGVLMKIIVNERDNPVQNDAFGSASNPVKNIA